MKDTSRGNDMIRVYEFEIIKNYSETREYIIRKEMKKGFFEKIFGK